MFQSYYRILESSRLRVIGDLLHLFFHLLDSFVESGLIMLDLDLIERRVSERCFKLPEERVICCGVI